MVRFFFAALSLLAGKSFLLPCSEIRAPHDLVYDISVLALIRSLSTSPPSVHDHGFGRVAEVASLFGVQAQCVESETQFGAAVAERVPRHVEQAGGLGLVAAGAVQGLFVIASLQCVQNGR